MLRPGEVPGRAIAVFPFLKTRDPITLESFTFRSTDDVVVGLDPEDATHVREKGPFQLTGPNWTMKKSGDFAEVLYFVGVPDGI